MQAQISPVGQDASYAGKDGGWREVQEQPHFLLLSFINVYTKFNKISNQHFPRYFHVPDHRRGTKDTYKLIKETQ